MWKAITYVSSGVTLAAFVAAVAAWVYKSHTRRFDLRHVPENQRAGLLRDAFEFFKIPTKLPDDQKFQLLSAQLDMRHRKFRTTCIVVVIIAFLGTAIVLFALWQAPQPLSPMNLTDGRPTPSTSSPAPTTSASEARAVTAPSVVPNQKKTAAPGQITGETTPVDKPLSPERDDVASELRQKNLIPLLNQANNFAGVKNSSADLQALALYKKVINGLSPGARAKLDPQLRFLAERADNEDNIEQAVRNYHSLFSIYPVK